MRGGRNPSEFCTIEDVGAYCSRHPDQPSGGICALCLKDRLSRLVCTQCGEQRPACRCSSPHNNTNINDARVSFLIESDNAPTCNDSILLLKRSQSIATPSNASETNKPDVSKACSQSGTTSKRSFFGSLFSFMRRKPSTGGHVDDGGKRAFGKPNKQVMNVEAEFMSRPRKQGVVGGDADADAHELHRASSDAIYVENRNQHRAVPPVPKLVKSRSVGCGRNSFSMDEDDADSPIKARKSISDVQGGGGRVSCDYPKRKSKGKHNNLIDPPRMSVDESQLRRNAEPPFNIRSSSIGSSKGKGWSKSMLFKNKKETRWP